MTDVEQIWMLQGSIQAIEGQLAKIQEALREQRRALAEAHARRDARRHPLAAAILTGAKRASFDVIPPEALAEDLPDEDILRLREVEVLINKVGQDVNISWITLQETHSGLWVRDDNSCTFLPMTHPAAEALLALRARL